MTKPIGILTSRDHPNLISDDQKLIEAFKQNGMDAGAVVWDKEKDFSKYSKILIRSPWDYARRWEEFRPWIETIEKQVSIVHNKEVILWNADKRYLKDIGDENVRKIETISYRSFSKEDFNNSFEKISTEKIVFKPLVGASGVNTFCVSINDFQTVEPIIGTKILAQPFMSSIVEVGEYSFIYFGSKFSHAVLKSAKNGEFRIQEEHGGSVKKYNPSERELEKIDAFLKTLPYEFLYCRVDVAIEKNELYLMELEVIEPELFFRFSDNGENNLAKAFKNFVNSKKRYN